MSLFKKLVNHEHSEVKQFPSMTEDEKRSHCSVKEYQQKSANVCLEPPSKPSSAVYRPESQPSQVHISEDVLSTQPAENRPSRTAEEGSSVYYS